MDLAKLRKQTFVGLPELNLAIARLLEELNHRPFKKLPGSRKSQFEAIDKPALKTLPANPYEYDTFSKARVHIDYHIEVAGHYYSVPHTLIKELLQVRLTATTVECFHNGQRVSSHLRSSQQGKHTTLSEHMPIAHQQYAQWEPCRFLNWAMEIGSATHEVIQSFLAHKNVQPEQNYRACFGLLRLAKLYGKERLESACKRAIAIGAPRRHSILSILKNGLDKAPLVKTISSSNIKMHMNIRGAEYYQNELFFSQTTH